ncbi:MAG: hypothetical protein KDK72_05445 [Chlamydiia bacterium]|nr:hypothetical protein [Chlamydiia bacterium]
MAETFSLFLVPDKVLKDGELIPITINNILRIIKGSSTEFELSHENEAESYYRDKEVEAHWVLMRNKIILRTRNKSFEEHERLVSGTGYEVPLFLDSIIQHIIYNTFRGNGVYREEEEALIRCKEVVRG